MSVWGSEIADEHRDCRSSCAETLAQVEHRRRRECRADRAAHHVEQVAVGIVRALGQGGAVAETNTASNGPLAAESGAMSLRKVWKKLCSTGPPGWAWATRNGTGVHGPVRSISVKKPGRSGMVIDGARPGFAHDLVAADIDVLLEVRRGGDRREPVALDGEAQDGDTRIVPSTTLLLQAAKAGS